MIIPPNSPDLDPLETIWGIMKDRVEKQGPITKQELEDDVFNT